MKTLSTSAFAKHLEIPAKDLFARFEKLGMIQREDEKWILTEEGSRKGGSYIESRQYGRYIAWPETLSLPEDVVDTLHQQGTLITATALGKHFSISARRINYILSELGWVQKALKGWQATEQGVKQGAVQAEDPKSGIPFVRWPETIVASPTLANTIGESTGRIDPPALPTNKITTENTTSSTSSETGFREKFPAKHRSTDGHMVRSKAEMLVDNWLYMAEIVHAYERKLPIEEEVYCDFYIPTGKVYIEYWGYENEPKYLARKQKKQAIYKKYGFNLIELNDADVQNLDDILPRLLLKYGVQAY